MKINSLLIRVTASTRRQCACDFYSMNMRLPWSKTGAIHYYAQLGVQEKFVQSKWLVDYIYWGLLPLDLLNDLAIHCSTVPYSLNQGPKIKLLIKIIG